MKSLTVDNFIRRFEEKFGAILKSPIPTPNGAVYTTYFEVFEPTKKYSDWDLKCWVKPEKATACILKSMESFVRSFKGFTNVGRFLTFSKNHAHVCQYVDNVKWLQLMAFMSHEKVSPFLDMHIIGVDKKTLMAAYGKTRGDKGFVAWAMLTSWRKLKNGDEVGGRAMITNFILPSFPESMHQEIDSHPYSFFEGQFAKKKGYLKAAQFLRS